MIRDAHFRRLVSAVALIAFVTALTTVTFPSSLVLAQDNFQNVCDQAEVDAKASHDATAWDIAGFFCGIFGWIFALASNPQTPSARIVGQEADYVSIYTRCYELEAKSKNKKAALIGWAIGVPIAIALTLATAE